MQEDTPPRPEHLPAGYDKKDPYEGEELSSYPSWWQELAKEFREYELRPYRPPQFLDGKLAPECVTALERQLSVKIRFKTLNPDNNKWKIYVDDNAVGSVTRTREGGGYTLYHMSSSDFKNIVTSSVD